MAANALPIRFTELLLVSIRGRAIVMSSLFADQLCVVVDVHRD